MQRATQRRRAVLPQWASAVVGGWCKGGGLRCGICGGGCSGCKGGDGQHKDVGLHWDGSCNGGSGGGGGSGSGSVGGGGGGAAVVEVVAGSVKLACCIG